VTLVSTSLLVLAIAPAVMGQDAKPQTTKGISLSAKNTLLLGAQIPALKG
jgi:hypothetical protein